MINQNSPMTYQEVKERQDRRQRQFKIIGVNYDIIQLIHKVVNKHSEQHKYTFSLLIKTIKDLFFTQFEAGFFLFILFQHPPPADIKKRILRDQSQKYLYRPSQHIPPNIEGQFHESYQFPPPLDRINYVEWYIQAVGISVKSHLEIKSNQDAYKTWVDNWLEIHNPQLKRTIVNQLIKSSNQEGQHEDFILNYNSPLEFNDFLRQPDDSATPRAVHHPDYNEKVRDIIKITDKNSQA